MYLVRPSVRPAIGYSRDVTDFTGRRANEKLVGCELARDYIYLPLSVSYPRLPHQDTLAWQPRFYPTFPATASCHEPDTRAREISPDLCQARSMTVASVEISNWVVSVIITASMFCFMIVLFFALLSIELKQLSDASSSSRQPGAILIVTRSNHLQVSNIKNEI